MKRFVIFLSCLLLLQAFCLCPTLAATNDENVEIISSQVISLGNGITIEDVLTAKDNQSILSSTTPKGRTATRTQSIKDKGSTVVVITVQASFRFDGSTVTTVSKSVTRKDTYDGWKYVENSFTANGGCVTLDGKITKHLVLNIPFKFSITCDKNGNIS